MEVNSNKNMFSDEIKEAAKQKPSNAKDLYNEINQTLKDYENDPEDVYERDDPFEWELKLYKLLVKVKNSMKK